jgi:hypothetical protein
VFHPRNLSMYAYAGNGPLNYIDPTGWQMWMSNYERGEYMRCKGMCHGYKVRETTPEENAQIHSESCVAQRSLKRWEHPPMWRPLLEN